MRALQHTRRRFVSSSSAVALLVLLAGCTSAEDPLQEPSSAASPSPVASSAEVPDTGMTWAEYLDQLTVALRTLHPDGDEVDWSAVHERLSTEEIDSTSDGYRAAAGLVRALEDRHSRFLDALSQQRFSEQPPNSEAVPPSGRLLDSDIAYLIVPASSGPGPVSDAYVSTVWEVLQEHAGGCGWIVDLQGNTGGDAWVMVQGVAPLLGEGPVLTADGRDGQVEIAVVDREVRFQGMPAEEWGEQPFEPVPGAEDLISGLAGNPEYSRWRPPAVDVPTEIDGHVPVALLYDQATASAAEATAIAMQGRPGPLRSFGSATAGIPTGVTGYQLVDGSMLALTTVVFQDRTGTSYEGSLEPDVPTKSPLDDAQEWLAEEGSCRS